MEFSQIVYVVHAPAMPVAQAAAQVFHARQDIIKIRMGQNVPNVHLANTRIRQDNPVAKNVHQMPPLALIQDFYAKTLCIPTETIAAHVLTMPVVQAAAQVFHARQDIIRMGQNAPNVQRTNTRINRDNPIAKYVQLGTT